MCPEPVADDDESELSDAEKEITDASSAKLLSKKQQASLSVCSALCVWSYV